MTKSRLIREFHLYWHSLAGGAVPERAQFDPIAVPQAIPSLMVVEYDPTTDRLRYRLSGTLADEHTGFKLTGCYLDAMFESHTGKAARFFDAIYRRVLESGVPEEGSYHWPTPRGLQLNITFGVFPLLVDGAVRQFICVEDYTELYGRDPNGSWSSGPIAAP